MLINSAYKHLFKVFQALNIALLDGVVKMRDFDFDSLVVTKLVPLN